MASQIMTRSGSMVLALAAGLCVSVAGAQPIGDPAAGREKSQACASCHGESGAADNAQFPKLAGQYADYLYHSLRAYKSGDRNNAVMQGQVQNLSDEDMRDLAAYYASQDPALTVLERN